MKMLLVSIVLSKQLFYEGLLPVLKGTTERDCSEDVGQRESACCDSEILEYCFREFFFICTDPFKEVTLNFYSERNILG